MSNDRIARFLIARIAEDEREQRHGKDWHTHNCTSLAPPPGPFPCDCGVPERMSREYEAKRRIVQRALDLIASFGDWDADAAKAAGGRVLWTDVNRRERAHAHDLLEILAEPYSDHPDLPLVDLRSGPGGKP